jgi:hypothetical protein
MYYKYYAYDIVAYDTLECAVYLEYKYVFRTVYGVWYT